MNAKSNVVAGAGGARRRGGVAFTLIELLVTISIIAVLAGIAVGGVRHVSTKSKESRLRAELEQLVTAIEAYKEAVSSYPPSVNVDRPQYNSLFYELTGVVVDNEKGEFFSKDRGQRLRLATVKGYFGVDGFANATTDATQVRRFIKLQQGQHKPVGDADGRDVELLVASVPWVVRADAPTPVDLEGRRTMNPWRYLDPDHATNNPGGFDLWIDYSDGKILKRMGNWARTPIILK